MDPAVLAPAWGAILPDKDVVGTNWDWILAIVFLVLTVRVILFPVFVKQIKSQRAMQALQPQVKELQDKHKGDRETMQKELMELYRKEKANPLMGCLPMFLQIPVFLGLFHVLKRVRPGRRRSGRRSTAGRPSSSTALRAKLFGAPIAAHFSSGADELQQLGAHGITVKLVAGALVADHDRDHLPDQPSDDPQDRLVRRPAAADDPEADALRHPVLAADLRWAVPDRRDHLLGHHQPVLARPAVLGPTQIPAAADDRRRPVRRALRPRQGRDARDGGGCPRFSRWTPRDQVDGGQGRRQDRRCEGDRQDQPQRQAEPDEELDQRRHAAGGRPVARAAPGAKPIKGKKGGPARRQSG